MFPTGFAPLVARRNGRLLLVSRDRGWVYRTTWRDTGRSGSEGEASPLRPPAFLTQRARQNVALRTIPTGIRQAEFGKACSAGLVKADEATVNDMK